MAWYGYFTYDGTEIINVERTDAYINGQNTSWFANDYNSEALSEILQETYSTPLTDGAPWTDPDRMESYDFWGVYPLNVAGLEDSTRESVVTQYTGNGGNPGRIRHATREPVFSVVLAGASECAVEYGFNWLKAALLGRVCEPNATTRCGGADLTYFSCEPVVSTDPNLPDEVEPVFALLDGGRLPAAATVIVDGGAPDTVFTNTFDGGAPDTVFPIVLEEPYPEPFVASPPVPNPDPTGCLTAMSRKLRNVQINDGPEVTAKKYLSDGSVIWTVTFGAVAGDPFEYAAERVVVDGFLGEEGGDPFGTGVDGPYDAIGYPYQDIGCPPQVWEAINDPLCPALVAPPGPVDIPAGCFEAVDEWWRRFLSIPEDFIPLWGSSVPIIGLTAQYDDLRQVRVRLYTDPTDSGDPEADECGYVADLMVSYVPQGYTLVIDGQRRTVYAVDPGGVARRADSLVFSSDGKPIIWPELTCGYGYLMTIDTIDATVVPSVYLSIVGKGT